MSVDITPSVVRPLGEIDIATADAMQQQITDAGAGGTPVLVDLRDVTFMDSSGVRALVRAGLSVDLTLTNVPDALEKLLALTSLTDHFHRA